jgi:hypothetical protein
MSYLKNEKNYENSATLYFTQLAILFSIPSPLASQKKEVLSHYYHVFYLEDLLDFISFLLVISFYIIVQLRF